MLTTRQAAQLIGLAPVTLRLLVRKGLVPHYRPGQQARFNADELRTWLQSRRDGPCPGPGG